MRLNTSFQVSIVPIYVNIYISFFDEDMKLNGYIDTLPNITDNGQYIYRIKFIDFIDNQEEKISKFLKELASYDRRDFNKRTLKEEIQLEQKKVQHKYKISNFSDRRKKNRRIINEKLEIDKDIRENKDRRDKERKKIEEKIIKKEWILTDRITNNTEKLLQFYIRENFIYRNKLNFLLPIKDEVINTIGKLLNCANNTCKYLFIMDQLEIKGSVMAVQYTDDTWLVQHLVTDKNHKMLAKQLVVDIIEWTIANKKMFYFLSYFQEKTKWALKTYTAFVNTFPHVSIGKYIYMLLDLTSDIVFQTNINISRLENEEEYGVHLDIGRKPTNLKIA